MDTPVIRPPFEPRRTEPCFCGSGARFRDCCGSLAAERKPPHGLCIIPSGLDRMACSGWVKYFEQQRREPVSIVDHHRSTPGHIVYRRDDTRVTDRVDAHELRSDAGNLLRDALTGPIAESTGRTFAWFIGPQVLRYQAGGFYSRHADSDHYSPAHKAWIKGLDRDISLLLYLNDDFAGGELSFTHFNYRYTPRAGDLLFFPSDYRYLHEAHPVTRGIRYVIVSWAAFTGEPRVLPERPENRIDLD